MGEGVGEGGGEGGEEGEGEGEVGKREREEGRKSPCITEE